MMAIFSRGDIAIGALDGGADCALGEGTPPGGAPEGGCDDAPPDAALTAVWQDGDN